jgi:putative ABC transport system ATP-binding protein
VRPANVDERHAMRPECFAWTAAEAVHFGDEVPREDEMRFLYHAPMSAVSGGHDVSARRAEGQRRPDDGIMIHLDAVTKAYVTPGGVVVALDKATLEIPPAVFVVVLGPSGSGKTTFLNMIGALDTPTEGVIEVAGQRVTEMSRSQLFTFRRQTISFIFQAFNLFPELTAIENVRFGAEIAGRDDAREVAVQMLEDVSLGHRMHHFPHELSGGEQQRVAIARSLASGNPILLADEPTGELDYRTGVQILGLLRARADAGQTVVLVTHNREIARMADLVVELADGRIVSAAPAPNGPADPSTLRW